MKQNSNNNETRNGMANVIKYAAGLLTNGATVESTTKHGFEFREIRKGNEYVCLCLSDFAKAQEIANAPAVERIDDCTTKYNNVTAARIIESVLNIAEAVGLTYGSSYPAHDAKIDIIRFAKWMDGESSDVINPAWPFFFAIRKQGSESGTREHCKSRCAVLGSPVYVIKVERKAADLFALSIRVAGHKAAAEVFAAATAAEDAKRAAESHQERENDNEPTNAHAAASETATANENEPQTENKSKAAELVAVVADYAAGTWAYTIKPAAVKFGRKAAKVINRAALYLFRFVWFAAIAAATLGTMFAMATLLADMPHTLTAWVRIPFGLVAVFGSTLAVEFALLAISKRIDRATNSRLLAMY